MLTTLLAAMVAASLSIAAEPQRSAPVKEKITVYRVQTCGCCGKWVEHLKAAGFGVTVNVVEKVDDVKGRERVPEKLRSCHVAFVGPYVVEGHVPADVIHMLLQKRPAVNGIAVPGMPLGSPGMESPNPQRYDVVAFDKEGRTSVFASR